MSFFRTFLTQKTHNNLGMCRLEQSPIVFRVIFHPTQNRWLFEKSPSLEVRREREIAFPVSLLNQRRRGEREERERTGLSGGSGAALKDRGIIWLWQSSVERPEKRKKIDRRGLPRGYSTKSSGCPKYIIFPPLVSLMTQIEKPDMLSWSPLFPYSMQVTQDPST